MIVAISSNFASAFSTTYGFKSWQSGLCFISGFIGSFLGIFGGGWISDKIANYLTGRNGGIREPEMRLPAVMVGVVMSPLALILYGVGIANKLHWMVPTLGLGFCKLNRVICSPGYSLLTEACSEFRNCFGYKRLTGIHDRLVSTSCWRGCSDPISIQKRVRLPIVILHEPVDCQRWVCRSIRSDGWNQRCGLARLGPAILLGKAHPTSDVQLECHEDYPLG